MDFILSVEIIIIALSQVVDSPLSVQIAVVSIIALVATVGVYGLVALIVRMDDAGLALMEREEAWAQSLGNWDGPCLADPDPHHQATWERWPCCSLPGGFSTTSRRFTTFSKGGRACLWMAFSAQGLAGSRSWPKLEWTDCAGFEGAGPGQKSWVRRSRKRRPSMGPYTREASKASPKGSSPPSSGVGWEVLRFLTPSETVRCRSWDWSVGSR